MTITMARAFCAFNALVLFASPVAHFFGLGVYVVGASVVFGLLNLTAAHIIRRTFRRLREVEAKEAPEMTPGQIVAAHRWHPERVKRRA